MERDISRQGLKTYVFVFNNDVFRECYGYVPYIKEKEVCYESYPHVLLVIASRNPLNVKLLQDLKDREYKLSLLGRSGEKLVNINGKLRYASNPLVPEVVGDQQRLPGKFSEAKYALLEIGSLREYVELPRHVHVYGKVTDFQGRPRQAYVELVQPYGFPGGMAITKTRSDGSYEMLVPKAVYHHAFICDGGYARSSLEFYAWRVPVENSSFRLDARFDKVEIYRLTAAETPERTLMVHFVVWDNSYTNRVLENIYREKGEVSIKDICMHETMPKLEKNNIEMYLGDNELEIRALNKIYYSVKDYGEDCLSTGYVAEAKIPTSLPKGIYPLRVIVHITSNGVEEWGESILYGVEVF
ncbi:MAG: hypothetical protein B6U76_08235 [Desulfurococcales archaeon ex4484_217_2]|nr:MAG: hypothetical protein B6U76_08235 [Desulfurococcales archaeon ex4484_217_2]